MNKKQQKPVDRSGWAKGPWDGEPDRAEWEHAGLPCLAVRNDSGAWCGYAAVPPSHPLHSVNYGDEASALSARLEALKERPVQESDLTVARMLSMLTGSLSPTPDTVIDVHGGLTYSGACAGRICRVPKPGEPDNVWWFGFDCAHSGDLIPRLRARIGRLDEYETYRDLAYVQAQTNALAEQLAGLSETA